MAQKLRGIRHRCKKFNLPFNLDINSLIVPDLCPILNIKLEYKIGKGPSDNSPSIDRIIPEKGYVKNNVRIISNRANKLKNNMTLQACKIIYEDLLRINGENLQEKI